MGEHPDKDEQFRHDQLRQLKDTPPQLFPLEVRLQKLESSIRDLETYQGNLSAKVESLAIDAHRSKEMIPKTVTALLNSQTNRTRTILAFVRYAFTRTITKRTFQLTTKFPTSKRDAFTSTTLTGIESDCTLRELQSIISEWKSTDEGALAILPSLYTAMLEHPNNPPSITICFPDFGTMCHYLQVGMQERTEALCRMRYEPRNPVPSAVQIIGCMQFFEHDDKTVRHVLLGGTPYKQQTDTSHIWTQPTFVQPDITWEEGTFSKHVHFEFTKPDFFHMVNVDITRKEYFQNMFRITWEPLMDVRNSALFSGPERYGRLKFSLPAVICRWVPGANDIWNSLVQYPTLLDNYALPVHERDWQLENNKHDS